MKNIDYRPLMMTPGWLLYVFVKSHNWIPSSIIRKLGSVFGMSPHPSVSLEFDGVSIFVVSCVYGCGMGCNSCLVLKCELRV